jgi:iron complex outermembrane receptor protein
VSAHVESLVSPTGPVVDTGGFSTPQGVFLAPGNRQGWSDTLLTRVTGSSGTGTADFRPFDPTTDFFNYAPYSYLQTPSERGALWLSGRRKVTDSVEIFAEGLAQIRRSRQALAPSDYSNFRAGGAPVDPATGVQVIPANNYYNPFGVNAIGCSAF